MKIRFIESKILYEDIASVQRQYSHIPEEDFNKIIRLDPTFDENRDSVGKYGKWLLGMYKKDNPLDMDRNEVYGLLKKYDEYKNDRKYEIEKDINKFKAISDMALAVMDVKNAELSNRQQVRERQKNKDYDIVYQDDDWAIFVPNTWEADVNLGKGTRWCTADSREESGKKFYDSYLREGGKYYIIMNKHNRDEKYQFHFETRQFMNADDSPINPIDILNQGMIDFFKSEGYSEEELEGFEIDWDEVAQRVISYADLHTNGDIVYCYFKTFDLLVEMSEDWIPYIEIYDIIDNPSYFDADDIYYRFEYMSREAVHTIIDFLAREGNHLLSPEYYGNDEPYNVMSSTYYLYQNPSISIDIEEKIYTRFCELLEDSARNIVAQEVLGDYFGGNHALKCVDYDILLETTVENLSEAVFNYYDGYDFEGDETEDDLAENYVWAGKEWYDAETRVEEDEAVILNAIWSDSLVPITLFPWKNLVKAVIKDTGEEEFLYHIMGEEEEDIKFIDFKSYIEQKLKEQEGKDDLPF